MSAIFSLIQVINIERHPTISKCRVKSSVESYRDVHDVQISLVILLKVIVLQRLNLQKTPNAGGAADSNCAKTNTFNLSLRLLLTNTSTFNHRCSLMKKEITDSFTKKSEGLGIREIVLNWEVGTFPCQT